MQFYLYILIQAINYTFLYLKDNFEKMQGVFQANYPATPYFDKILNMMAETNIQELNYCIKKCSVLQNLENNQLDLKDKVCLGNRYNYY